MATILRVFLVLLNLILALFWYSCPILPVWPDRGIFWTSCWHFSDKSSPNKLQFLGNFKWYNFHVWNDLAIFGAIYRKVGQLFIPSSGHTGYSLPESNKRKIFFVLLSSYFLTSKGHGMMSSDVVMLDETLQFVQLSFR